MDNIESRLTTLEVEIKNLKENIDNTRGELKSDINNLKVDLNKGFDRINISGIHNRLTILEERQSTYTKLLLALSAAIPTLTLVILKAFGI
jgi:chromosome segregation ATPase